MDCGGLGTWPMKNTGFKRDPQRYSDVSHTDIAKIIWTKFHMTSSFIEDRLCMCVKSVNKIILCMFLILQLQRLIFVISI